MLPEATLEDRIANRFHVNTQTNTEGGTDDEEFRLNALIDPVNTTWAVWQGTIFGCVQCHSRPMRPKDPLWHGKYDWFLSMWNSTEDAELLDDFPHLKVPQDSSRFAEAARALAPRL